MFLNVVDIWVDLRYRCTRRSSCTYYWEDYLYEEKFEKAII